jgi:hypothetical protein
MPGEAEINIDLSEMRQTSANWRSDTESGLSQGLSAMHGRVRSGVRFGLTSPSGETDAAKRALRATLDRHWVNSVAHLDRATQLAKVLDLIIARYQSADAATVDSLETLRLLNEALPIPGANP